LLTEKSPSVMRVSVFVAIARLLVGGLRIGGLEVNRRAVRRPRDVAAAARRRADRRLVRRQLARFAAVGRQQIDLRGFVVAAFGDEGDRLAVG
jgi:hypothetical protein